MKRFLSIFTALLLCLTLCACGESQPETTELSEETSAAVFATWRLKDHLEQSLKNLDSLQINALQGGQGSDGDYIFALDYSAQNGFGGMNREWLYLAVTVVDGGCAAVSYGSPSLWGENQTDTKLYFTWLPKVNNFDVLTPSLNMLGMKISWRGLRLGRTTRSKTTRPASCWWMGTPSRDGG